MSKTTTLGRVPKDIAQATEEAERELQRPPDGKTQQVAIVPAQITTHPLLFQSRSFGNRNAVDAGHVKKLTGRISTKGELDPPLVVKLGEYWVCVDGHHRVAAYLKTKTYKQGSNETITCEWFPGGIQEAIDESIRRNDIDKLEMHREDRYEAAWQRVVLDWGSKREIVELTNVSDGLVAMMRRVKTAYEGHDVLARRLQKKLPGGLTRHTWSEARLVYIDADRADWDMRKEAAKLAKLMRSRMHHRLADNPIVTAHALMIYDPTLPQRLIRELETVIKETEREARIEQAEGSIPESIEPEGGRDPLTILPRSNRQRAAEQPREGLLENFETPRPLGDADHKGQMGPVTTKADPSGGLMHVGPCKCIGKRECPQQDQ